MMEYLKWFEKRGDQMLNDDFVIMNVLTALEWWHMKWPKDGPTLWSSDSLFVRDVHEDRKVFQGQRMDINTMMLYAGRHPNTKVLLAPDRGLLDVLDVNVKNNKVTGIMLRSHHRSHLDVAQRETGAILRGDRVVERYADLRRLSQSFKYLDQAQLDILAQGWLPSPTCTMSVAIWPDLAYKIIDFN